MKEMLHRFKGLILKKFLLRVGFWSDRLYDFNDQNGQVSEFRPSASSTKLILVVSREYYIESVKDYPISRASDLRKVLRNEIWRFPYDGLLVRRIDALPPQSHRVTSWVIKQEVFDQLGYQPFFVVPESACLQYIAKSSSVERLGRTVFVAETPDGLISSLGKDASLLRDLGTLPKDIDSSNDGHIKLDQASTPSAIFNGLLKALTTRPYDFATGIAFEKLKYVPKRAIVGITGSVLLVYLIFSSLYLLLANNLIDYKLAEGHDATELSLGALEEVKTYSSKAKGFKNILTRKEPLWVAWDILLDVKKTGVTVRAVNRSSSGVTYFLTAESSTAVLGWFMEDPRIAFAEFALPVRSVSGQDQFAVRVELKLTDLEGDEV